MMSDFNFPIPDIDSIDVSIPSNYMWADTQFEILREYITKFEQELDNDHEVGILLTNFGQSVLMRVTSIAYEEPVLMVFTGIVDGREATLIQHINQLNFLLTTVEKEPDRPKRRIGFHSSGNNDQ